jgi:ATP-dependent exoDNAse (exonuclease V) alpha subunit
MLPHSLDLKVGAIAMIVKNINMKLGLCNGTRCIVRHIFDNFLDVEIISGNETHIGQRVFLPRMDLYTQGADLPFTLRRRQFPIKLAFCITINKAQGQTFKK